MKWKCQKCECWYNASEIESFYSYDRTHSAQGICPECDGDFFLSVKGIKEAEKEIENAKDNQCTGVAKNYIESYDFAMNMKKYAVNDKKYDKHGNCTNQITEF